MQRQLGRYLSDEINLSYMSSLWSIKTKLASAGLDDRRPTFIRQLTAEPDFHVALGGKLSTIYALEEYLAQVCQIPLQHICRAGYGENQMPWVMST